MVIGMIESKQMGGQSQRWGKEEREKEGEAGMYGKRGKEQRKDEENCSDGDQVCAIRSDPSHQTCVALCILWFTLSFGFRRSLWDNQSWRYVLCLAPFAPGHMSLMGRKTQGS